MELVIINDYVKVEFCKGESHMLHLHIKEMQVCSVSETNQSLENINYEVLVQVNNPSWEF